MRKTREWLASRRRQRSKILKEDILKEILSAEASGLPMSLVELEATLGQSGEVLQGLLQELIESGEVEQRGEAFQLTPSGREAATAILRAHRILERFLADETGYSQEEWHARAEIAEHHISAEEVEALSSQLGNPAYDPHGDPIPTAVGEVPPTKGIALYQLPLGTAGRIVHLEDEPEDVYRRLLFRGLAVGSIVYLFESSEDRILVWVEGEVIALRLAESKNVFVAPEPDWSIQDHIPGDRLSELEPGEEGSVIDLSPVIRGQERRRLMDLGVIPGTLIRAEFASPGGDPMAFRVRGTLLALRKDQTDHIRIQRSSESAA